MISVARKSIAVMKETLDKIPTETTHTTINFLNTLSEEELKIVSDSKYEIMAFKRVHTRGNPNFEPLHIVEDLDRILRKGKGKYQEGNSQLETYFYLSQEEILSLQGLDFYINFEQSILKSKSKTDLKKVMVDQNIFQSYPLDSLLEDLQKTVKT